MKNRFYLLFTLFLALYIVPSKAQQSLADTIGDVVIRPVVHGTLSITWQDQTLYIDPYGGADRFSGLGTPTMILITDIHGDHYNPETLNALNTGEAIYIVPQAVDTLLPQDLPNRVIAMNNGDKTTINGIGIEALPMYNLPETDESRHPKGRGNGYILTLGDQRIYISGDTEDIPEMRALNDIDIAFVCMNMPYTMTVEQAASAVNTFQPEIIYPYHYRGRPEMSDTGKFKSLVEAENTKTEVRLRDWYREGN